MTILQSNWARSHDWYHSEQESENGIIVFVREQGQSQVLRFIDFHKLYIWAGY